MLWDGIHLTLQKAQKKVPNTKEQQTRGFYIELNVLILYLKTGDRKFIFSEMV